jgi:hypothetical protein
MQRATDLHNAACRPSLHVPPSGHVAPTHVLPSLTDACPLHAATLCQRHTDTQIINKTYKMLRSGGVVKLYIFRYFLTKQSVANTFFALCGFFYARPTMSSFGGLPSVM